MHWIQETVELSPKPRGFHLVTSEIVTRVPAIRDFRVGLAHLFVQHTSASLSINENADPTVRRDLECHFNAMVPEEAPYYRHTAEGPDDMPAHIKSVLLGRDVLIPITRGSLNLGTWQGIYLCEHRNRARARLLVVTLVGEPVA